MMKVSRLLPAAIALAHGSPLSLAAPAGWTTPYPAHTIAGNLHYVGSRDLASYLITTSEGHILVNSSLESSVPLIRASVEQLGFKFSDIKILLISHAHSDHCAGSAEIIKQTGAKYMVMEGDAPAIESGGDPRAVFDYLQFPPAKVDRVLKDGDEVKLGDAVLVARLTPGHTRGCTTWTMKVRDREKVLNAVIIGSPNVNGGTRLVNNRIYPTITEDYQKCFSVLKALPVDLFLGAHGGYYGMTKKHALIGSSTTNPFIDPEGYHKYIDNREKAFLAEWERQKNR